MVERRNPGPPDNQARLVEQATQGDARALDSLLEMHLPALLGYVRLRAAAVIRDHESCVDIVQSVCREVLEDAPGFQYLGEAPFRKWLFTKAMAKLVDRKRYYVAEKRNPGREIRISQELGEIGLEDLYASFYSPSQAAMAKEDVTRFERAFARLPPDYQQVITLARLIGMTHGEIAVEMGRKEGAVRVLLHRALARLGLAMHEDEESQPRGT